MAGRFTSDNIAVAFKLMHSLKKRNNGQKGWMGVKLDMSKAYDRVEWGFLAAMVHKIGFGDRWCCLLMDYISTPTYSFVINDQV